jgi:hypothetical protein
MSSTENTERRLLASIRQAKGTPDSPGTPAPRPRRTSASRAPSKPAQTRPADAAGLGSVAADPYQGTPRVWPD